MGHVQDECALKTGLSGRLSQGTLFRTTDGISCEKEALENGDVACPTFTELRKLILYPRIEGEISQHLVSNTGRDERHSTIVKETEV